MQGSFHAHTKTTKAVSDTVSGCGELWDDLDSA